jgi:hypothetical protein
LPQALSAGDVACLVGACPRLRYLSLEHLPLVGPVFSPLSRLVGLRELFVGHTTLSQGPFGVTESLSHLPPLSELRIQQSAHDSSGGPALWFEDVVPHLPRLTKLRSLTLDLPRRDSHDDDGASAVHRLSALTRLTELSLDLVDGTHLGARDIGWLAACPLLASLELASATLDAPATRLLATRLPLVTELRVAAFDLDEDLSALPCAWRELNLNLCPCPRALLKMPRPPGMRLDGDMCDELEWGRPPVRCQPRLPAWLTTAAD